MRTYTYIYIYVHTHAEPRTGGHASNSMLQTGSVSTRVRIMLLQLCRTQDGFKKKKKEKRIRKLLRQMWHKQRNTELRPFLQSCE